MIFGNFNYFIFVIVIVLMLDAIKTFAPHEQNQLSALEEFTECNFNM